MTLAVLAEALPPGAHDLEALTLWLSVAQEAGLAGDAAQPPEQEHIATTDPQHPAQHWRFSVPRVLLDAAAVRGVGGDV